MRKQVLMTTVLSFLVCHMLWCGQSSPAATAMGKVGVISIQDAVASTAEGKKALSEIQKKYQPRQQDLQRQQQEIAALQDQLQKQATTLSDEERFRLSRELEEKQKLFKRATEDYQADFQDDNQAAFRRILQKMVPLINEYAQKNSFVLIIDPAAAQVPVYYLAKEIDVTEDIVKRFDAANPAEAPATPGLSTPVAPAPKPAVRPPLTPRPPAKSKPQ